MAYYANYGTNTLSGCARAYLIQAAYMGLSLTVGCVSEALAVSS